MAAHEDFSGLVTRDSPARAGEIVHFYLTGLGAVSPPVATGAITPAGALHRVTTPLSCSLREARFGGASAQTNVLFAGLAPGMIGVDQVDIPIPRGLSGTVIMECQAQLQIGTTGDFVQIPVAP